MQLSYIEERVMDVAKYTVERKTTIRETAKKFAVSKSTIHKDLTDRLPKLDYGLYRKVRNVLNHNLEQRHIRGGEATKEKYSKVS